jgi:ketosteroid isomerase-like protein
MAAADAGATCAIQALSADFVRVYNAGDLDGLVKTFYTEDADPRPPHHPCISGRPQVRRFFQDLLEAGVGELSAETIQIDVSGDLA